MGRRLDPTARARGSFLHAGLDVWSRWLVEFTTFCCWGPPRSSSRVPKCHRDEIENMFFTVKIIRHSVSVTQKA